MGGKSKKGCRAKDNARPSSSSHCAELLGNNIPLFYDFSNAKDSLFGPSEDMVCTIDTSFQLVFKKMSKKDAITKLKALQEFNELCKKSEPETIKAVLPFWPRLYCSLATDVEHRVREAVHIAHGSVVEKAKKSVAPYLKQIAGPWFTSQYDNYPPAASAASLAFEQAFPPEKQSKVIQFCQKEILSYIYESLIEHTPQSISNPKITNSEEMEAKYQRIVIASLQGYNFYLQKMSSEQIRECEESNRKIVSSKKFWDYSKNETPLIRNSFFGVLISLCQNGKFLLDNEMKRLTVAIFGDLDDSDPMVMASVWDAVLNALVFLDDCWSYVNLEKQVFPKLNAILKKGGRNALAVLPNILPLLSKIPLDLIKDKHAFYGVLLHNIAQLMETSSAMNMSHSDGRTISVTLIECLKYIIMQNNGDASLCNEMVCDHLLGALERKLSVPRSTSSSIAAALFSETSKLLRCWHSAAGSPSRKINYGSVSQIFWSSLLNIYDRLITSEPSASNLREILNNQLELLSVLENPDKYSWKGKGRIKFADQACAGEELFSVVKSDQVPEEGSECNAQVLEFAKKVASLYYKNCVSDHIQTYIPALNNLVQLFDSRAILEEFLKVENESNLYFLFENVFGKWLENPILRRRELVDLSFSILHYLSEKEKELILEKFCRKWSNSPLQYDICRCLLHYSGDDCVHSWLSGEEFSKHLVELTRNLIASQGENLMASGDVVTKFFEAKDGNGECIIPVATASAIMDLLSCSMRSCRDNDQARLLAQKILMNINPKMMDYGESSEQLVIELFKLSCVHPEEGDLVETCGVGLSNYRGSSGPGFLQKLADSVLDVVFDETANHSMDNIVARINYFIHLTVGCDLTESRSSNDDMKESIKILKHFLREPTEITRWRKRIEKSCSSAYLAAGECHFNFIELWEKNGDETFNHSQSDCRNILSSELDKIISHFDDGGACKNLRLGIVDEDSLKSLLTCHLYSMYGDADGVTRHPQLDEDDAGISREVLIKFSKWNLYAGKLLNLLASSHPKSFRVCSLREVWCPYYVDEGELKVFTERNPGTDVVPVEITREEMNNLRKELDYLEGNYSDSDYEEKINLMPVSCEIFHFTFSLGLLVRFSQYYAGTEYFPILQQPVKELTKLGRELYNNANLLENLFFYHSYKYFFSSDAKWRMVKPVVQELFCRDFHNREGDPTAEDVRGLINGEVSRCSMGNGTLLKLLSIIREDAITFLTETEWNRIFIYLHKFFQRADGESIISEDRLLTLSILSRILLLLMKSFRDNHLKPMEKRLCPEACLAWNEVAEMELYKEVLAVWEELARKWHDKKITPETLIAAQNASEVVTLGKECDHFVERDKVKLALEYCSYIMSPYSVFQTTSYQMLLRLVPDLVKMDTEIFCNTLSKMTEDVKEGSVKTSSKCEWTCSKLDSVISHNQGIVETLLSDFVIGDCCSVEPFTDAFNYTYSYLLIWCLLLEMCSEAHSSLRFQYGLWLRDKGYTNSLLDSIFKLLPQSVICGSESKENCHKYFEAFSIPSGNDPVKSERIEQISCFVYRMFLQRLPTVIREWWGQCENKTSTIVDKVTSLYVSSILIANELRSAHQDREDFDNMEIKTHPTAREVIASYTIDEVKMDLVMTLPANYPLGTIKVESSNAIVSSSNRRNWLFHISKYLIHQNGTIWDALVMWKNNLDKKFEGVEECYICASILQGSTFETPRVSCQICKKKFHSHCLYKWFSTSNNSSCPICRNLF